MRELIERALAEDIGAGDITTDALIPPEARSRGVIDQKAPGVIAGRDVARAVFETVAADFAWRPLVAEGEWREVGSVAEIEEKDIREGTASLTAMNPEAAERDLAWVEGSLTREDLVSKSRSRPLTTARHVAMYLTRECTGLSLIKIGELFDRDHTTVLHGIRKTEELMRARGSVYTQVQALTRKIRTRERGT